LLGIDLDRSHEFEHEITSGCEGIKPGWVRVNFNYFISEAVFDYVVEAVRLVAHHGWRLLGEYRFDVAAGRWHHRAGLVEPPLRLAQVSYAADGEMVYPHHDDTAPESALADYLKQGEEIMLATEPAPDEPPTGVSAEFEQLRWFDLPARCVED
jgi:hypothetical protein